MASFQRRRGTKKVYVYYRDKHSDKLVQLPRKQTKHLDLELDEVVRAWVDHWEKQHGHIIERSERIHLKETDKLQTLWTSYQTHRNSNRNRRSNTSHAENGIFETHILPFFIGTHNSKLPNKWHSLIPEFQSYLVGRKLSIASIQKTLWALERFGKHLVWQRYMEYPFVVAIPASKNTKVTPLKVRKSPEDILKYVKQGHTYKNPCIKYDLAILLGYFAALGPGELFALSKEDLLTGLAAEQNTKTLLGFRDVKLGSKLSVVVNKTLPAKGKDNKPIDLMKNDYRQGVVNIWNAEAAKLIASMVKEMTEGRLFPFSYGHLVRMWRENVLPILKVTPHDLRRSSALYLGRTLRIPVTLLQEHMRHAEIETTMLYMREPSVPEIVSDAIQDFDDVA